MLPVTSSAQAQRNQRSMLGDYCRQAGLALSVDRLAPSVRQQCRKPKDEGDGKRLEGFLEICEDFVADLRRARHEMLLADQASAQLGSLNAEIAAKQEKLADLENHVKQILAKLHLRQEAA
jgi:hypothetical protein